MPFKKGDKPVRVKQKGDVHTITKQMRTVKECVLATFLELQDDNTQDLKAFAKEYPKDFYNIAAKLIPTEVQGTMIVKKVGLDLANEDYV